MSFCIRYKALGWVPGQKVVKPWYQAHLCPHHSYGKASVDQAQNWYNTFFGLWKHTCGVRLRYVTLDQDRINLKQFGCTDGHIGMPLPRPFPSQHISPSEMDFWCGTEVGGICAKTQMGYVTRSQVGNMLGQPGPSYSQPSSDQLTQVSKH